MYADLFLFYLTPKMSDNDKPRRRLPVSVKELIEYHDSDGKSIKEIVQRINSVCKSEEKVTYGVRQADRHIYQYMFRF